jgi:hypothetical protein
MRGETREKQGWGQSCGINRPHCIDADDTDTADIHGYDYKSVVERAIGTRPLRISAVRIIRGKGEWGGNREAFRYVLGAFAPLREIIIENVGGGGRRGNDDE